MRCRIHQRQWSPLLLVGSPVWRLLLGCGSLLLAFAGLAGGSEEGATPFRFCFSGSMLANINTSDARAAVKAWAQIVAKERHIPADPDPSILDSVQEIDKGIRARTLDAIAMTLPEYRQLSARHSFAELFVAVQGGRTNVNYHLLVRADSGIRSLEELEGKTLNFYENPRTSLALIWLDTLLAARCKRTGGAFLGRVTRTPKLASAVLPVFFKKCDAALVDGSGFVTMCELNPQLGQQMRILETSPLLVPSVFCFRADYQPSIKGRVIEALSQLHTSPAGLQVLTVLQYEKMQLADASCLQSGLNLLAQHERLCGHAATPSGLAGPATKEEKGQP